MDFFKTTILPSDEKRLARDMFQELVHEQPLVLTVVLGKGQEAELLVQRASKMAGAKNEPWQVVWARKPEQIEDMLRELKGGDELPRDLATVRGVALTYADSIVHIYKASDPVPDLMTIMAVNAEAVSVTNA